tara:strand:+ start:2283 stop:2615 length:333 start_codon:yes stop_codon:yes gene_type:complete
MAKLLNTRLPIANTEVTPELFNRLVRLLELNLGEFDPSNTEQFTTDERDKSNFNIGTVIFNTTTNSLQIFDGVGFADISEPFAILTVAGDKVRFSPAMTASLGVISITIS